MDASSVTQALESNSIKAFGIAMPQLAQDWIPAGSSPNATSGPYSVDDTTEPMKLTLDSSATWAAPCTAELLVVNPDPTKGQPMPVTLLNSDGTAQQQSGVLLTLFETAWLRLGWLYVNVLEASSATRPEQSKGLPYRQVPRYFFYTGQTNNLTITQGLAEAQADLTCSGDLWIYDNDGLLIDPIAVMSVFNALMTSYQLLQAGTPVANPALGTYLATLLPTADVRVRIVNPDGTPNAGSILTGLTAITGAPSVGVSTISAGTAVQLQAVQSPGFTQDDYNRVVFGLSTSGRLTSSFTPPSPKVSLQRDFFTLRLVSLTNYLLGAANPTDPATQAQAAIDVRIGSPSANEVRINENISLLTNGNDLLGAIGQSLASPANPTLAVAQALDGTFAVPANSGPAAYWPTFPGAVTANATATLPYTLPASLKITAAYFNTLASDFTRVDVVLTITGFPVGASATVDTTNSWVRIYTRLFGVDATQQRGDGAGRAIPASGTVIIYLADPLGLKVPGTTPSQILVPSSATLNFDMSVILPNQTARIYGGLSAGITAGPTPAPIFMPGTNSSTSASFQGVSNAGILGLGSPSSGPPPTTLAGWVAALTGEGTPRDASRFPTMARREMLVAGLNAGKWSGVIGGGRFAKELVCNLPRIGEPGGYGGRETSVTGASTQGGRLAYDIARHALRRSQNIAGRVATLAGSAWSLPAEPGLLSIGQTASATTSGTFAGSVLQNIAPYCETPEAHDLLANNTNTLSAALDNAIDWLTSNTSILPGSLGNQQDIINALNSFTSNPPSGAAKPTNAALLIAGELLRELCSSAFGRRDSQWALASALASARHFIYIETPGFCSTADNTPTATTPVPPYVSDLIALINARLTQLPGLRVILCVPKYPDFAKGYEGMAAYEVQDRYNILISTANSQPPVAPQLPTSQVVSFHPIGFPGRYSRVESTVVIVDDTWALVGGSSFRRRGLTFDGSSDLVLTDTQLANGRSPGIRDFRRSLMAARLGIPTDADHPSYIQLYDGQQSFNLIRTTLQNGGLGYIDRMWNGQTPSITPTTPLPLAQANPEGRAFDATMASLVSAIAASTSGV